MPIDAAAWDAFAAGLRYVTGEFADEATFARLAAVLAELGRRPRHGRQPPVLLRHAAVVRHRPVRAPRRCGNARRGRRRVRPRHHREAVRPRPRLGAGAQRRGRSRCSDERRSSASTTTWARRRSRTSSSSASPTRSSSRCGTARYVDHVQITVGESIGRGGDAASSTRRPARCATSCRTTCCSCWR